MIIFAGERARAKLQLVAGSGSYVSIIVRTSVPAFNAYGGCCPPRRSIAPKMSPVRRKIPLGAPSGAPSGLWHRWRHPCLTYLLGESSGPQGPRRARAIDQSRVGREGGCVRGGWVVSGVGCRGRHFAASRNASSFLVLIGFGAREVSILERLSAAHCDEGRVVTTETNERLHLWQLWQR